MTNIHNSTTHNIYNNRMQIISCYVHTKGGGFPVWRKAENVDFLERKWSGNRKSVHVAEAEFRHNYKAETETETYSGSEICYFHFAIAIYMFTMMN